MTTVSDEFAMHRLVQNASDAPTSSKSPTRTFVLNPVDYGLLAMLLATLVLFGATLVGD